MNGAWIALVGEDDEEEAYMIDDGSLALAKPAPTPTQFRRHVDLPADGDVSRATTQSKSNGVIIRVPRRTRVARRMFQVVNSPGVYVRESRSLRSPRIGYKRRGEILACADEVDGWLKLADERGWMLKDGWPLGMGLLLSQVEDKPPENVHQAATRKPTSKGTAPPQDGPTSKMNTRGAPNQSATPASSNTQPATPACVNKRVEKSNSSPKSIVDDGKPVLCECEASDSNVQGPPEAAIEHWVAVEDGGFVPIVRG